MKFAKLHSGSRSLQKNIWVPPLRSDDCWRNYNGVIVGSTFSHSLHDWQLAQFSRETINLLDFETDNGYRWVLNPFLKMSVQLSDQTTDTKENLIDLAVDCMFKMKFYSQNFDVFWVKRKQEYSQLASKVLKLLLPFATSNLHKLMFFLMVDI